MRYRKRKIAGVTYQAHRVVWEEANGPIPEGYFVHHKNHDKLDNRLENLELMSASDHSMLHNPRIYPRTKVCEVCGCTYEPHITKRRRSKTCSWDCRNELIRRAAQEKGIRR